MSKKAAIALKMTALAIVLVLLNISLHNIDNKKKEEQKPHYEYICIDTYKGEKRCVIEDYRMGTSVSVTVYGERAGDEAEAVFAGIDRLDGQVLTLEVDKLLANKTEGEPYPVSDELYRAIEQSLDICEKSNGALDITIQPLIDLWGIERACHVDYYDDDDNAASGSITDSAYVREQDFEPPDDEKIKEVLENVGYENVKTFVSDDTEKTKNIIIEKNFVSLSMGAIGKGYALDIAKEELIKDGAKGACVIVGGSVLLYGVKPDGEAFTVGIRDPKGNADDIIGQLTFSGNVNVCISTSGDYEKYVEADGVRYHHILDSKTGYPANSGLSSVTVVCESGLVSDGLSTACFVLGYEKSLELLKMYNAEAVFIDKEGNITVTDGLEGIFEEVE